MLGFPKEDQRHILRAHRNDEGCQFPKIFKLDHYFANSKFFIGGTNKTVFEN